MSSKPTIQGATETLTLITGIETLDSEIGILERRVAEMRPTVERLAKAKEERAALNRQLLDHLTSMDCESVGNYGWESRFSWLLREVVRQARGGR